MSELVIHGTPWETYKLKGIDVHVKREDLCCPAPGPSFSKIRGADAKIKALKEEGVDKVGVLDTIHSKAGWGVAYLCKHYGLECIDFYPVYKAEFDEESCTYALRYNQLQSMELGATMVELKAGRSAILMHQAKKIFSFMTDGEGFMMPNALRLPETILATTTELLDHTSVEFFREGTWIISISSGTIAAGVIRGLAAADANVQVILHMGYSRSTGAATKAMHELNGGYWLDDVYMVDEGFDYRDSVEPTAPFPCNKHYDAKAWRWLENNISDCEPPIIFWNIGA